MFDIFILEYQVVYNLDRCSARSPLLLFASFMVG